MEVLRASTPFRCKNLISLSHRFMKSMYDTFMTNLHAKPMLHRNKARPAVKEGHAAAPDGPPPSQSTGPTGSKFKAKRGRRLFQYTAKMIAAMEEQQSVHAHATVLVNLQPRRFQTLNNFKVPRRLQVLADLERVPVPVVIDNEAIRKLVEVEVVRVLSTMAQPESPALRSARERGLAYARAEYEKPEHLSLAQASAKAKLSERIINERRNAGRYYALILEGNTRGFRFPEWQFGVKQERLAPVLDVMREAQASCWMIHNFLIAPNSLLGNMTPRDYLLDADRPLDHLINIVRGRFTSDQGAG